MAKLDGYLDTELHPNIHEALKVLANAQEAYDGAVNSIDGQYLRSLDVAYANQANAVRRLFAKRRPLALGGAGVRSRKF